MGLTRKQVLGDNRREVTTERSRCTGQVVLYLEKCRSRLFVSVGGGTAKQRRTQRRRYFRCTRWPDSPPDGSAPTCTKIKFIYREKRIFCIWSQFWFAVWLCLLFFWTALLTLQSMNFDRKKCVRCNRMRCNLDPLYVVLTAHLHWRRWTLVQTRIQSPNLIATL